MRRDAQTPMLDLNPDPIETSPLPELDELFQTPAPSDSPEETADQSASGEATPDLTARSAARLSPKMRRFVLEYLKDFNGNQAAIRAGYSPRSARITASKMLADVRVQQVLAAAEERMFRCAQASVARVRHDLSLIAFFDPASLVDEKGRLRPLHELTLDERRGMAAISFAGGVPPDGAVIDAARLRFTGKLRALNLLARHFAMFTTRIADDPADSEAIDTDALFPTETEEEDPAITVMRRLCRAAAKAVARGDVRAMELLSGTLQHLEHGTGEP
jgi:phage terminase small subunit